MYLANFVACTIDVIAVGYKNVRIFKFNGTFDLHRQTCCT